MALAWVQFPWAGWVLARWLGSGSSIPRPGLKCMRARLQWPLPWAFTLGLWGLMAASCPVALSQDQPPATPVAPEASVPGGPSTSTQPAPTQPTVAELAERLRAMEEKNRQLAEQLEASNRVHNEQMKQLLKRFDDLSERSSYPKEGAGRNSGNVGGPARPRNGATSSGLDTPVPDYTEGQLPPFSPPPGSPPSKIPRSERLPLNGTFGPGFQFETEDEEFQLRIHYESQIERRNWARADQEPANSGFFLPRQRIFFTGNITKPIEYELAINRASGGSINVLNAFINVHFDDRFEVRFGRFFTPFTYDQYAISNYWLPTPERSLFTTNVGLGRQIGLMGWGYLFDKRLDYGVDFVTFLNARPFQESESLTFARFLNLGTSFAFGHQDQLASPTAFRIGGASPNSD